MSAPTLFNVAETSPHYFLFRMNIHAMCKDNHRIIHKINIIVMFTAQQKNQIQSTWVCFYVI